MCMSCPCSSTDMEEPPGLPVRTANPEGMGDLTFLATPDEVNAQLHQLPNQSSPRPNGVP